MRFPRPLRSLSRLAAPVGVCVSIAACVPTVSGPDAPAEGLGWAAGGTADAGPGAPGDTAEPDDSGDTGDAGDAGVGPGDDVALTPEECADLCSERAEQLDENAACPFEMRSGDCPTACAEYSGFTSATQEAFATCVTDDALCYEDIDDCVARRLYPRPAAAVLSLTGTGFGAVAGKALVVGVETPSTLSTVTQRVPASGDFDVTFTERVSASSSQLAIFYVDVDGDGRCDPSVDVTGSARLDRSFDIEDLSFSAATGLPERAHAFVCDYL